MIGKVPSAAIRWGGLGIISPQTAAHYLSNQKPGLIVGEERASVGCFGGGEKWIRWGLFGRGCAFLARWMAHGALAVMQHNAAVSQLLRVHAGGAWHGHPAPAAPARPHPGPGLPLVEAWSCFYLVVLPQLDVASGGPGHLVVRGEQVFSFGMTPPAPPVGQGSDEGAPCSANAGRGNRPADADRNLIPDQGRGCRKDRAQRGAEAVVQSVRGVAASF